MSPVLLKSTVRRARRLGRRAEHVALRTRVSLARAI